MEAGVFASLVTEDKIAEVVRGIETAVLKSFEEDMKPGRIVLVHGSSGAPRATQAEAARRTQLCLKIFRALRGDLKWTLPRAIDHLSIYLRKELDGEPWEPEAKRASWMTGT